MASPGENVSLAVTIGTIFNPVLGLDHLEFLFGKQEMSNEDGTRVRRKLYRCLDKFSVRTTYDEYLLYASQGQAFEGPVEEWGIADWQKTLVVEINKSSRINDPSDHLPLACVLSAVQIVC